eukprot:GHRQ01033969.1.p1 GENE.GHRQ01033969.1~~GHRQ01033969.1.p1  ORF type:complete len:125 (-),score=46.77 GHRQ01033969.1:870-1244(-)
MLFLGALVLPDTPNSLIERGKLEQGEKVLKRIRGVDDVTVELEDIVDAVNVSRTIVNPWATILRRRYRPQLVISILIPTFQQWVGINVSALLRASTYPYVVVTAKVVMSVSSLPRRRTSGEYCQ